ncbi:11258_t:CDS:2 [Funneliformis geosporum]|nr:11258_t:CDS:2 [Funneliformis geosporum]
MLKSTITTLKKNKLLEAEYSAINVANYLLSLDPQRKYFTLELMSRKKPLFKEQMLSFEHGAVVEIVRTNFIQLYSVLSKGETNLLTKDKRKEEGNIQAMPLNDQLIEYYADFLDDLLEEDDGQPTKKRSHLVIEINETNKEAILLKITSK